MTRSIISILLITLAALGPGCVTNLDRNAPGHAPLAEPPKDITYEGVETPEDPGERVFQLGLRPGVIVGGLWHDGRSVGAMRLGAQLVAGFQERERSENLGDTLRSLMVPQGNFVAVGWDVLTLDDFDLGDPRLGALHAQWLYRWRELAGGYVGAGYAYDPFTGAHGPIVTTNFLYLNYVRMGYLAGEGFHLGWGITFEIPHGWVWSR